MADLILRNINKSYGTHEVIPNLDLHIKSGEFVTLLGPSGCGKTTLLRMIAGLEKIDSGTLEIGGVSMEGLPAQKRPIGMVFQSYALFPHLNVKNNIAFGLKIKKRAEHEIFEKLDWVLPLLGLEGLESRLPKELSGGQRQRVALARALVLDPEVLLLDEPLSNLDAALRELAMEELKRIHSQVGKTIIYVSHNQAEAMTMSQRIAVMNKGHLEQCASPMELYDNPASKFVSKFIGSPITNSLSGKIVSEKGTYKVETVIGNITIDPEIPSLVSLNSEDTVYNVSIRPQDIHLYQNQWLTADSTVFAVTPTMIETPGDRLLVVAETENGDIVRFFVNRLRTVTVGVSTKVYVDSSHVHMFDSDTGKNVKVMDK